MAITIQWMRVKFCLASQNQRYYLHTKFHLILRWSCENFCWPDLEWPICHDIWYQRYQTALYLVQVSQGTTLVNKVVVIRTNKSQCTLFTVVLKHRESIVSVVSWKALLCDSITTTAFGTFPPWLIVYRWKSSFQTGVQFTIEALVRMYHLSWNSCHISCCHSNNTILSTIQW